MALPWVSAILSDAAFTDSTIRSSLSDFSLSYFAFLVAASAFLLLTASSNFAWFSANLLSLTFAIELIALEVISLFIPLYSASSAASLFSLWLLVISAFLRPALTLASSDSLSNLDLFASPLLILLVLASLSLLTLLAFASSILSDRLSDNALPAVLS